MRVCLVSPLERRGPWRAPEYGVASWPLALGGDLFPYDADDLAPLDAYGVVLLNVDWMHYGRIAEILGRLAGKARVLMLTCDAMFIDPQGFFPEFRTPLAALMDRADLVVSETEELGFFQAMTATPVVHLPLPVPLAAMRAAAWPRRREGEAPAQPPTTAAAERRARLGGSLALPPAHVGATPKLALGVRKEAGAQRHAQTSLGVAPAEPRVYLGAGFRAKKNGVATAMAFRRLRERVPDARGVVFAEEPEAEAEGYRVWGVEGVEVRPACDQPTLWPQVAACGLALHLDYRRSVGRFSGECAALGVPCVSTAGATMQRACFPELIVEPWDVEGAAALGARVLREPLFRDHAVAEAGRAVERFALAPMAARLREALSRLG